MSIFSNKKVYETSWSLKSSRGFSADEIAEVENAVVVEGPVGCGECRGPIVVHLQLPVQEGSEQEVNEERSDDQEQFDGGGEV